MSPAVSRFNPRRAARCLLVLMAAALMPCHGEDEPSLFAGSGTTPAELGRSIVWQLAIGGYPPRPGQDGLEPDPFPLVVLPATTAERQELLDVLKQKGDFAVSAWQRVFVAMLLEGWGRADEALAWLESEATPAADPLHLVRLRYRTGDLNGAATAFSAAQEWDKSGVAGLRALPRRTNEWLRPFVAMELYPDLAKFLEWLQPQCRTTDFRGEILQLRLNVAYQQGKTAELLGQLATAPPPLKDLAKWLLTHDPATLPARLDDLTPGELLLFHRVSPRTPALNEAIGRLITSGRGTAAERSELLFYLSGSASGDDNPLLELWFERDPEVLAMLDAALPTLIRQGGIRIPNKPITALADRHPGHPPVNLLAGLAVKARHPVYATSRAVPSAPANPYLLRACNAPMLETAADEPMDSNRLLPRSRLDVVGTALAALSETLPPGRLFETVSKHPDFTALPTRDKARYLALAKLDLPFLETLLTVDWSDPKNDNCGSWAGNYLTALKSSRLPDHEWMARVRAALPAMLAGSAGKAPELVRRHTLSARSALADTPSQEADFRALLAEVTGRLQGDARKLLEDAANAQPSSGSVRRPLMSGELASQIEWFEPARMVRWVDQGLREQALPSMMNDRSPWSIANPALAARYPVLGPQQSRMGGPRLPGFLQGLLKLRALLPPDSPHTTAMDLAVAAGRLPAVPGEVTDMAKSRVAALIKDPRHLDLIVLRIQSTQLQGTPPDLSPLANLTDAPFLVRKQAVDLLAWSDNRMQPAQVAKLRTQLLGAATLPAPPVDKHQAAYDRLHRVHAPGGDAGPEEVKLAEEVLRDYLTRGGRETSPTENVAISILVRIGRFESFLKEVAAACRALPEGEVACAKAMHALHQYTIIHKNGESLAFAKRVLELDPDDLPAARQCVRSALTTGDHATLLAALPALRKGDPRSFAETLVNQRLPQLMPHAAAPRLLEIMAMSSTLEPAQPPETTGGQLANLKRENVEDLHLFFQEVDPALAARFREWLLANGWYPPAVTVPALVNALCEDQLRQDAAAVIAAAIIGPKPPAEVGPRLRFAAVPEPLFQLKPAARAAFDAAVSAKLCQETLDLLPVVENFAGLRGLLRYATLPSPESYRSELVSLLDKLPASKRSNADSHLPFLLESVPAATEHRLMAVGTGTPPDRFPVPDAYTHRSAAAWDLPALRAAWQRLRTTAGADKSPDARSIFSLTPAMVESADEPLWTAYAAELLKAIPEAKDLQGLVRMLPTISRPESRTRLTPILQAMTGATNATGFHQIAQAAWLLDDEATLTAVEQRLKNPPDNWMNRDLKPLAQALLARKGDPELVQPMFRAVPGPELQCRVDWALGGDRSGIPPDPLTILDGAFDLTILAGPDNSRMTPLHTIASATALGSHSVELPAGTRSLGLSAKHRIDGKVLPVNTRDLDEAELPSVEVQPPATPGPGVHSPKSLKFPFDHQAPVTGLFLTSPHPVMLAPLPWQPGQALALSAWVLSCGGAQLELRALDANDKTVRVMPLVEIGSDRGLPTWHQTTCKLTPRETVTAERMALFARRKDGDWVLDRAPALWLADLRFAATDTDNPPPDAVPVGRLAGDITAMNCTPDGSFLAIGLRDGRVAVMETATAAVGFFSPKRAGPVTYVAIGGRHLLCADATNSLRLMDLNDRTIRRLGTLTTPPDLPGPVQLGLTPDGEWLVWSDRRQDVRIARVDTGGLGRPVTLAAGAKPSFIMDRGAVLVSGESGHFRIPFADLPTLDPADLQPLAKAPVPESAVRTSGPNEITWTIPARQLHIRAAGTKWSFNARDRTLLLPTTPDKVAVTATGTVFYATAYGQIYQLDPTAVEADAPPPFPAEEPDF